MVDPIDNKTPLMEETTDAKYVVIDLGSSFIRGMLAQKTPSRKILPLAFESIPCQDAIRHGCVYNIDKTASIISKIIQLFQEKLPPREEITGVYVGFGGQTLESREVIIERDLEGDNHQITEEHLKDIEDEAKTISYKDKVVLHISQPYYEINGRTEYEPQGIISSHIKANYQLIVAKPSVRRNIEEVITYRLNLRLLGILITPLAEAMVAINEDEMKLGCCYVNIGGGVTTVSIFQSGIIKNIGAIPIGGISITHDLTSLKLIESDAEDLKIQNGAMNTDVIQEKTFVFTSRDGEVTQEFKQLEVNRIILARMQEITANYLHFIHIAGIEESTLSGGIILNGNAARMNGYQKMMEEISGMRYATVRASILANNTAELPNFSRISTLGLTLLATKSCISYNPPEQIFVDSEFSNHTEDIPDENTATSSAVVEELFQQEDQTDNYDESQSLWKGDGIETPKPGDFIESASDEEKDEKTEFFSTEDEQKKHKQSGHKVWFKSMLKRLNNFIDSSEENN